MGPRPRRRGQGRVAMATGVSIGPGSPGIPFWRDNARVCECVCGGGGGENRLAALHVELRVPVTRSGCARYERQWGLSAAC